MIMKKTVLSFVCIFIASLTTSAQGVKFEAGTWEEILTKAKAEHKTVFVDVYTKWCGPCKKVSETVFPQEKVGEVYNSRFINFKIDAESPAGKEFVKNYPVGGYPTFFFIDGKGRVVHKIVGFKDAASFIEEAGMLAMYERYGGIDSMMTAIKNGTAGKELLYDYYRSANQKTKPAALNQYLKALPAEELVNENNKLIQEITLYNKELTVRLIDEIVKASNDGRFSDGKYAKEFAFNVVFPVQSDISGYLNKSIEEGNEAWLNELLEVRERFAGYGGRNHKGGQLLDGDQRLVQGRGLFFATSEYIKLCYWTKNRTNEEGFPTAVMTYMDKFIRENPADSLLKENKNPGLQFLKEHGFKGQGLLVANFVLKAGDFTAQRIIGWTDYFWKISPSDKKTKALCSQWIEYAFKMNPYNADIAIQGADLLARIGNLKKAVIMLETAITKQQDIQREDAKIFRQLELKLRDVKNGKL